eukprot:scaffold2376_cov115-Isochrysis_galbana.AAC.8
MAVCKGRASGRHIPSLVGGGLSLLSPVDGAVTLSSRPLPNASAHPSHSCDGGSHPTLIAMVTQRGGEHTPTPFSQMVQSSFRRSSWMEKGWMTSRPSTSRNWTFGTQRAHLEWRVGQVSRPIVPGARRAQESPGMDSARKCSWGRG